MRSRLAITLLLLFFSYSCSACNLKPEDVFEYLNSFTTMQGDFNQHSDGVTSVGLLLISKPFHTRWEYYSPDQIIINSNGSFATYYDKDLDQSFSTFTDDNVIDLLYDNVQEIKNRTFFCKNNKAFLKIDREAVTAIFKFATKPVALEGVDIIHKEAPGNVTSIDFFNLKYDIPIKASIFNNFD